MDFARKQLEKYGWSDGKGLGKHENGISEALRPKIKRSVTGIGHDPAADFTEQWWSALYDKAANNVEVKDKNGKTKKIKTKDDDFQITNSSYHLKKKKKRKCEEQEEYSEFFVKTAVLDGVREKKNINECESEEEEKKIEKKDVFKMTDEELFAACEGRTAHKGARHGLKATGKLARIQRQEQMLLLQPQFNGYSHAKEIKKKVKKNTENLETMENSKDIATHTENLKTIEKYNIVKKGKESKNKVKKNTENSETIENSNGTVNNEKLLKNKVKETTENLKIIENFNEILINGKELKNKVKKNVKNSETIQLNVIVNNEEELKNILKNNTINSEIIDNSNGIEKNEKEAKNKTKKIIKNPETILSNDIISNVKSNKSNRNIKNLEDILHKSDEFINDSKTKGTSNEFSKNCEIYIENAVKTGEDCIETIKKKKKKRKHKEVDAVVA